MDYKTNRPNPPTTLPAVTNSMDRRGPDASAPSAPSAPRSRRKEVDDSELLERMRKRFELAQTANEKNEKEALDDVQFTAGIQWPAADMADRQNAGRPTLTINKLPTFIHQLTNDQRMNSPGINVVGVSTDTDVEASRIYKGLIRAIERDSNAEVAYDTAFESAVTSGIGFFRMVTEYAPDSFDMRLRIKRIKNPFSVMLSPYMTEPDGSDNEWAFISDMVPRDEFETMYPDADPMSWDTAAATPLNREWIKDDSVRVAEYFEVETTTERLLRLSNGTTLYEDEVSPQTWELVASGVLRIVAERDAERRRVMQYKATAKEILERQEWPGQYIPVFPVIGNEIDIAGQTYYFGLTRFAKDSQRLYNYWTSNEAEAVALVPKAPYIIAEGQVSGYEDQWRAANRGAPVVLTYRAQSLGNAMVPPPARVPPAGAPEGIIRAKEGAANDMMATTGIRFDATPNERMIDESGKAIRELRRSGDLTNYHYADNLARSKRHLAVCIIDMAPKLFESGRYMSVLNEDGGESLVEIDLSQPKAYTEIQGQDGSLQRKFNPKVGKYSVTIDIGPSHATKRMEDREAMMAFAKNYPTMAQVAGDLIVKAQDWPSSDAIARRIARTLPPAVLEPDRKDITPQVQGYLTQLKQQLEQMQQQAQMLQQQNQQLQAAVEDREADRQVAREKILRDYAARIYSVTQQFQHGTDKLDFEKLTKLIDVTLAQSDDVTLAAKAQGNLADQPRTQQE